MKHVEKDSSNIMKQRKDREKKKKLKENTDVRKYLKDRKTFWIELESVRIYLLS